MQPRKYFGNATPARKMQPDLGAPFSVLLLLLASAVPSALDACGNGDFRDLGQSYDFAAKLFNRSALDDCGCDVERTCVRKCCAEGYFLVEDNVTCVRSSGEERAAAVPFAFERPAVLVPGCVLCEPYRLPRKKFFLTGKGRLSVPALNYVAEDYDQFCVDRDQNGELFVLYCFEKKRKELELAESINNAGVLISITFLFATLVIYALLPERNLHGNALICYVSSLLLALLFLVSKGMKGDEALSGKDECLALAIPVIFFSLASFFWMNAMCIDIWWTFSGFNIRLKGVTRSPDLKRFRLYSAYAWGVPFLWTVLVTLVSFTATNEDAWYYTGLRQECWFSHHIALLVYYYGPMAALILSNVILFLLTLWEILKAQKDVAILKRSGSRRHRESGDRQRFLRYIKLLLIMGVNWSMEIVSWLIDWQIGNIPPAVWYLTDLCNALYGVLIFFLFCFNKKVWRMLRERYYRSRGTPTEISVSTETARI